MPLVRTSSVCLTALAVFLLTSCGNVDTDAQTPPNGYTGPTHEVELDGGYGRTYEESLEIDRRHQREHTDLSLYYTDEDANAPTPQRSYVSSPARPARGSGKRFQIIDRALGMPAMDITLPAGYRAEGYADSGADGWGLDFMLVKLTTGGNRTALFTNSITARDGSVVFGGARANLTQMLQQQCVQDVHQKLEAVGLSIRSGLKPWSTVEQNREGAMYLSEFALADGREGGILMHVPANSQRAQYGYAMSSPVITVIAPADLPDAASERFLAEVLGIYKSAKENPRWAQTTAQNNRGTLATNQRQSDNFNAQLRSNFEAQQRSHNMVVEGHRRYNESVQRGAEVRSRTSQATADAMSGHGSYRDPYTGEEILISNDLGPGSQTYINQHGEYIQTEDPNFDPNQLPEGWQPAPQTPY